jgi:hypothetical protein
LTEGRFANRKVPSLVSEVCSLIHLSLIQSHSVLDELATWMTSPLSATALRIVEAGVSNAFSTVVAWDETEGATMTRSERAIIPSEPVQAFRRKALGMVSNMLSSADVNVRHAGAACVKAHGHAGGGMVADDAAFNQVLEDESTWLAPAIGACLRVESSLSVMSKLEEELVWRWASQRPGEAVAESLLKDIEWPPLLTAFRLSSHSWDFWTSIREVIDEAPSVDRWHWWVARGSKMAQGVPRRDVERVVETIRRDHGGASGVRDVAEELAAAERPEVFLDVWCSIDPRAFQEALNLPLSALTRERLRRTLQRHTLATPGFDLPSEVKARIAGGATAAMLQEFFDDAWVIQETDWLSIANLLVSSEDLELRRLGLDVVRRGNKLTKATMLTVLAVALRDGRWIDGWREIQFVLDKADVELGLDAGLLALAEARMVETLISDQRWKASEWHLEEVLRQLLRVVPRRRGQILDRLAGTRASWKDSTATIAAPLISNMVTLKSLLVAFGQRIENQTLTTEQLARVLRPAAGNLPTSALEVAELCLSCPSTGVGQAGVVLLQEMRGGLLAAEACARLAEEATNNSTLSVHAERALWHYGMPQGAWTSSIGEPAPAYVRIQQLLDSASLIATGAGRTLIAKVRQSVVDDIARQAANDAEFLDPR